eukprot:4501189-Prymnesium_polylepis.1
MAPLFLPLLLLVATVSSFKTPIHAAVEENDPTAVRAALAAGGTLNEKGEDGLTPLMRAVHGDKLRAAAALMKMGADATVHDTSGLKPLDVAAKSGFGKIVRLLLRYGVDTAERGADGLAPFHRACAGADAGHTDAVFAFLDAGVPPDQTTANGALPIDMSGSSNTRKLLQEALQEKWRKEGRSRLA